MAKAHNAERRVVRHGLPIIAAGMLLFFAGCRLGADAPGQASAAAERGRRRLVRKLTALLRGPAIDVRFPDAECATLPRRTRAELRESPQRIASARARLARLRLPNSYERLRTRLDEGLRLIAEANKLLLAWSERPDDAETPSAARAPTTSGTAPMTSSTTLPSLTSSPS